MILLLGLGLGVCRKGQSERVEEGMVEVGECAGVLDLRPRL